MRDFWDEYWGAVIGIGIAASLLVTLLIALTVSAVRDSRSIDSCIAAGRPYYECRRITDCPRECK